MFKKILVANRGEIACRVIKTCQSMGIKTVAVYSDADIHSMHVAMADEAIHIGGSASSESYLVIENILKACRETGAEAVHPGYGFLSENESFAKELAKQDIAFIGPNVEAIINMGDKIESKKIAEKAGVNVIPGFTQALKNADQAVEVAKDIGYPVMLKASSGGGGKGMRVVNSDAECRDGFERAQNESRTSFGDDRVFAEKFITEPHHIEIQILADQEGNTLYIGERECSIQRRHQKVIEESPSPFINDETRKKMGAQAVLLAKAVDYQSAGTVEFIVDKDQQFYFLEMNTRLQVEHPVTEKVTGLDLVEQMILIAAGNKLSFKQDDVQIKGWALECRIYAEDPYRDFMPSIGRLTSYLTPTESELIRVDTGFREGSEVSMFYDPMIAKLITYGPDRNTARETMLHALDSYNISGVSHNLNFLSSIMQNSQFIDGYTTTNFIDEHYPDGFQGEVETEEYNKIFASVLACYHHLKKERIHPQIENITEWSVTLNEELITLKLEKINTGFMVHEIDQSKNIQINKSVNSPITEVIINDQKYLFKVEDNQPGYTLTYRGRVAEALVTRKNTAYLNQMMPKKTPPDLSKFLLSPMPGLLIKVCVSENQTVKAGEELAVVEAMKMENSLRAANDVKIKSILAKEGDNLMVDQTILEFED
ncbi:acetyl/propionyl/methylcrotonyl-CoA carboxylase subunit alpha [Gammaproteobacteria bacterium]|nr:acetyl/propionyl/methylcrotonyl-CoA carboxylase subunit alpha [Gammaproteobacteria bacterium]